MSITILPDRARETTRQRVRRFLFGDDVFISYSRRGGADYALALAAELTKHRISCFLDQFGTPPGEELPEELKRRVRSCNMFVLVGTATAAQSENVKKEVEEFLATGRPLIPITFFDEENFNTIRNGGITPLLSGTLEHAPWFSVIRGIALTAEAATALETKSISARVLDRVINAEGFASRSRRLRSVFWSTLAGIVVLLAAGSVFATFLVGEANKQAAAAEAREKTAETARSRAEENTRIALDSLQGVRSELSAATVALASANDSASEARKRAEGALRDQRIAEAEAAKQQQLAAEAATRAERMTRYSQAVELAIRAEDRLVSGPGYSIDALRLGIQSLGTEFTAWGESAVRRGLLLLPTLEGVVQTNRPTGYIVVSKQRPQVVFGPAGMLARWSYDEGASRESLVYRLEFVDGASGRLLRDPVELQGYIQEVRFTASGSGVVVFATHPGLGGDRVVWWVPRAGGAPHRLPTQSPTAFALHPTSDLVTLAGETIEEWRLDRNPAPFSVRRVSGALSVAYTPDGRRLYALLPDKIVTMTSGDESSPWMTVVTTSAEEDASILATSEHIAVVESAKIRTWSIDSARWDHDFPRLRDGGVVSLGDDRLAMWSESEVEIRDLSETDISFDTDVIRADCGTIRSQRARLLDVSVSGRGDLLGLACSNATKVVSAMDGTHLSTAPSPPSVQRALYLDDLGTPTLYAYAAPVEPGTSAQISRWTLLNTTSNRIGGTRGRPKQAEALGLSSDGSVVVALFSEGIFRSRLRAYDPSSGNEFASADTSVSGFVHNARMVVEGRRIAISGGTTVSIWAMEAPHIRLEATFEMPSPITAINFDGAGATKLVVTCQRQLGAQMVLMERTGASWKVRTPIEAGSWTMPGSPDDIRFAPADVSENGRLAFLAPDSGGGGAEVWVTHGEGRTVRLQHDQAVTALRFASENTLLVATRSGRLWAWTLDGDMPVRRQVGKHDSPVLELLVGETGNVLAVDKQSVIRLWTLHDPSENIGLRGIMEFPLGEFGIANYDALGTKAIALSGERLVTLSQHARGVFASAWTIPSSRNLLGAAASRLRGAPAEEAP